MKEIGATFKPETNKRSRRIVEKRGQDFEMRLEESMKQNSQRQAERSSLEFPFKPKLSNGTKKILRKRNPNDLVRRQYADAKKKEYVGTCTLKPKTNKPKDTKKLNAYLKQPAHERLSENKTFKRKTRAAAAGALSKPEVEDSGQAVKAPCRARKKAKKKLSEDDLQELFTKMYKYAEFYGDAKSKLKQELRRREAEEEARYFKPQLKSNEGKVKSSKLKIKEQPLTKFNEDMADNIPFKKADELEGVVREKLKNLNGLIEESEYLREAMKSPTKIHQSYYVRDLKRQQKILNETRRWLNLEETALESIQNVEEELELSPSIKSTSQTDDGFDSLMELMDG